MNPTVVGIDVGGEHKGFHAVALRDGKFLENTTNLDPSEVVSWCHDCGAAVVAVDAPCRWSRYRRSRFAERELSKKGIHCFFTPTKQVALGHDFYKWMLNGERLFNCLESREYPLFHGERPDGPMCIETFPHAIVCAITGRTATAERKTETRRQALKNKGYDTSKLLNIDLVDAALCTVAAKAFYEGNYKRFGDLEEGFIIMPNCRNTS